MEDHYRKDGGGVRISNPLGRSPRITPALRSPVQSVHPDMQGMESINTQADFGLRTADFMDYSSGEESARVVDSSGDAPNVDLTERRASAARRRNRKSSPTIDDFVSQCEEKRDVLRPDEDGYRRLDPGIASDHFQFAETPSSSYNGSVDELLPDADPRGLLSHQRVPQTIRSSPHAGRDTSTERRTPIPTSKVEKILGAHAIAHEITLQALMRDEDALDRSLQSFSQIQAGDRGSLRGSLLPAALRLHDPRSPRTGAFSTPQSASSKKVQILPPPIDTSGPRSSLPSNVVRTPYPFTADRVNSNDGGQRSLSAGLSTPGATESILTVRMRRANVHGFPKVTSLTLPAFNDFSAVRSSSVGEKERHFRAIDFDDEEFFRQLQSCYCQLSGLLRFISARSLV